MSARVATFVLCLCLLASNLAVPASAQEIRYREEPMGLEEMKAYKDIAFQAERFDQVREGMSEKDVLSILGKPLDMKKEQRRGHRWTFHYFYPDGHVVNFKNGLVVGKEKP